MAPGRRGLAHCARCMLASDWRSARGRVIGHSPGCGRHPDNAKQRRPIPLPDDGSEHPTAVTSATVTLYLPRGDAKSLRTAEISNWTGKATAAPRTELDDLLAREELAKAGVCIRTYVSSAIDRSAPALANLPISVPHVEEAHACRKKEAPRSDRVEFLGRESVSSW